MRPSADLQLQETLKFSLPLTGTEGLEDTLMASVVYAGQDTWTRLSNATQRSRSTRSRRQNLPLRIVLASAISVVALLVTLSICKALHSRGRFGGVTPRRLSEDGHGIDEDERSIVESCLDLEEEMGILQQRATSSPGSYLSSQIPEIPSISSEASAGNGLSPERSNSEKHPLLRKLLKMNRRVQPKDGQLVPPHASSLQAHSEMAELTFRAPSLDPDSWLDSIPSIGIQPEEQGRARDQEWAESLLATDDEPEPGCESGPPVSKRRRLGSFSDLRGDISSHPYVRLPVLEDGVVPRDIDASILFDEEQRRLSSHVYLLTIRELFAKEVLSQQDTNILVNAIERLVTTSWLQSRRAPRRNLPVFIVETLGTYLIAFDAIICARQILGDHMQLHLWWEKFANSFNTQFRLIPPRGKDQRQLPAFHRNLANRLMAAMRIYKRGERPPLSEIVNLKTLLFCSPLGNHRLKEPKWDPWREDGGCA
ncbi:hypothetical protein EBH_0013790 [Eimeria brunetti]|uniref:Uncharacterized protein n=1 Tax=Eimeria brunetti TaxID=51314 RepID=U6L8V8_9EIME|nr:hypothetical protein EBH_0013790 [Eimeria brunetti]